MYRSLTTFVRTLAKTTGWRLVIALALLAALPLTEGAGIALLFPILQISGVNLGPASNAGKYANLVAHFMQSAGIRPTLLPLLAIFVAVLGLRAIVTGAQNLAVFSTCMAFENALRDRLYRAIVNADWLFIVRSRSSEFIHALTGEMQRVSFAASRLMQLAGQLMLTLVYLIIAFKLSMPMTLLTLASGALLAFLLRHQTRALHASSETISVSSSALYSAATEHLQNLKTVKTYGAQERDSEAFSALSKELVRGNLTASRRQLTASFWFEAGSIITLGAVVYFSLRVIAVPAVELFILIALFSRLMPKLSGAYNYYQSVVQGLPAFSNLMTLEARCAKVSEAPAGSGSPVKMSSDIRLDAISFAYEPGNGATLTDIDMVIPAGSDHRPSGTIGRGKEHARRYSCRSHQTDQWSAPD